MMPLEKKLEQEFKDAGISWVVIGGQTNPVMMPEIEWVKEIVEVCDEAGVKVWLKENMISLFKGYFPAWATARGVYRQEFPVTEKQGMERVK